MGNATLILAAFREMIANKNLSRDDLHDLIKDGIMAALARRFGPTVEADIRIDDPTFADRHARLDLVGDRIILRDLGSAEGTLVNGEPMRDALLRPGDQVVFDAHHRFVVEAPMMTPVGSP